MKVKLGLNKKKGTPGHTHSASLQKKKTLRPLSSSSSSPLSVCQVDM